MTSFIPRFSNLQISRFANDLQGAFADLKIWCFETKKPVAPFQIPDFQNKGSHPLSWRELNSGFWKPVQNPDCDGQGSAHAATFALYLLVVAQARKAHLQSQLSVELSPQPYAYGNSGNTPNCLHYLHSNYNLNSNVGLNASADLGASSSPVPLLTDRGGPTISNVKVFTIFWGSNVNYASQLNNFYKGVTNSVYMDWLSEYNTPTQKIGRGSFIGTYNYTTGATGEIDNDQVQSSLLSLIDNHLVPAPDLNTLYAIHFAPGINITMQNWKSCVQYCAYHYTIQHSPLIYYSVIPDQGMGACPLGCNGGGSQFQNLCSVSAHELVEAITDGAVGIQNLAWYDDVYFEIADICNGQPGTVVGGDGVTYTVQQAWSNQASSCLVSRAIRLSSNCFAGGYGTSPLSITWSVSAPSNLDWIGIYPAGRCSTTTCPTGAIAGTTICGQQRCASNTYASPQTVTIPISQLPAGQYDVFYMRNSGYQIEGIGANFTIGCRGEVTPNCFIPGSSSLTVKWTIASPGNLDWIGVYPKGRCSTTSCPSGAVGWARICGGRGGACPVGTFEYPQTITIDIPQSTSTGQYSVYYFRNNKYKIELKTDITICPGLYLSNTCLAIDASTLSVTWSIPSPGNLDWIGIYPLGSCNTTTCPTGSVAWAYICGGQGGACSAGTFDSPKTITIPISGLAAGIYEILYMRNDGYNVEFSNAFLIDMGCEASNMTQA